MKNILLVFRPGKGLYFFWLNAKGHERLGGVDGQGAGFEYLLKASHGRSFHAGLLIDSSQSLVDLRRSLLGWNALEDVCCQVVLVGLQVTEVEFVLDVHLRGARH